MTWQYVISFLCGLLVGGTLGALGMGILVAGKRREEEWTNGTTSARLIAASPDLLEVTKLVVESQGWDGNDPDEDRWKDFYTKARMAIARAEGREP